MTHTLVPEWHPQWGVLLAWPHADTDWADLLEDAEQTYSQIARAILARENLLLICRDAEHETHIRTCLADCGADTARLHVHHRPYNDTWARDFGPLTVRNATGDLALQDMTFTGWGGKFDASLDNAVNASLAWAVPLHSETLVLEGGAIDINSDGVLLTTSRCLLNPNRNPQLDRAEVTAELQRLLGCTSICWLEHGDLEGDDTDAHVDTLARFCNDDTVAYVQCTDANDSHYPELSAMEAELEAHARAHGWRLVPLPHAPAQFHRQDGYRLPATYANFLIINDAVLMPTYGCDTDAEALAQLQQAFTDRTVIGIDCQALIQQHGSLHCVTMQLPEGVL